jgi:hypothetical protein
MSAERYAELVRALCETAKLGDPELAVESGCVEIDGHRLLLQYHENDGEAMYLCFDFGPVATARVHRVLRLMLEANMSLYAQDQAQFALDAETGAVLLSVRVPMTESIDGAWMAETCTHYTEHGKYWRDNLSNAGDDAFNGLCEGRYMWIRAG